MIGSGGDSRADLGEGAGDVPAEAALWVARHRLGTIDEAAFARWRAADPRHGLAFCRALAVWEGAAGSAATDSAATDGAVKKGEAEALPLANGTNVSRRGVLRAAGIAATIVAAGSGTLATRAYAWSTAETAIGENRMVALPDGSMAWLNTDSRLSWRLSGTRRMLWVERGEVALNLVPGPEAVVHGEGRTLALSAGRFNARLRGDTLDLLVLQGRAWNREQGRAARAAGEGQSLLASPGEAVARNVGPGQIASALAWQKGEILFQDMTLGMAVEEYNRFLDRKIVIVDRELAGIPVGGRFTSTDPTAFLHALSAGLDIRVARSQSAFLLTR